MAGVKIKKGLEEVKQSGRKNGNNEKSASNLPLTRSSTLCFQSYSVFNSFPEC